MHIMEVALFASFVNHRRQSDEPMPEQWPRPRRSRAANIALAAICAVGITVIVVAIAVAG
jgi:hypothetical protein